MNNITATTTRETAASIDRGAHRPKVAKPRRFKPATALYLASSETGVRVAPAIHDADADDDAYFASALRDGPAHAAHVAADWLAEIADRFSATGNAKATAYEDIWPLLVAEAKVLEIIRRGVCPAALREAELRLYGRTLPRMAG